MADTQTSSNPPATLEPVTWLDDGSPQSGRFGDVYHSRTGGLMQSGLVFLGGCGLPGRWRGTDRFTVLETGFGLGLNFLVTWAAWELDPARSKSLHYCSVEAYPVAGADIQRNALLQCASSAEGNQKARIPVLTQQLVEALKDLRSGVQTLPFAGGRVQLTLAVGQAQAMLEELDVRADALYLDGFGPEQNPEMWSVPTLQAATRRCGPGSTLATYSTAPEVRARLEQLGWRLQRVKGLPPKRHRLEGLLPLPRR